MHADSAPAPGSDQELGAFAELQQRLRPLFERVFPDPLEPRTVVVVPALSLDADVISKITGVQHYEERLLCMLLLLRLPRTKVIYITSTPLEPAIVDYYLGLLPGVPGLHARKRLTLMSCNDNSAATVTEKLLERPRLLERLSEAIGDPSAAHMSCFNVTEQERTLAVRLGIPVFGCDPELAHLGSKSGSRRVFRAAGIDMPDGHEGLRDEHDMVAALTDLKRRHAGLVRAAVKLEQGTSGEGNAVFTFDDAPEGSRLEDWIRGELPARLRMEDQNATWDEYRAKFAQMGGVVECWIEGEHKRSPSVQCRIDALDRVELISTHDQVLGGPSGQIFLGSTFPADEAYRLEIQDAGMAVGEVLRSHAALGRYGVDFVSVREGDRWKNYAIEINLRKGGTTHTFLILKLLTDGHYEAETGLFRTAQGAARFYYATDNLKNANYRRMTAEDLMDITVEHGLAFHAATQQGVFFHLIGALSGYGKLGLVCVARDIDAARKLYRETVDVLDAEALKPGR